MSSVIQLCNGGLFDVLRWRKRSLKYAKLCSLFSMKVMLAQLKRLFFLVFLIGLAFPVQKALAQSWTERYSLDLGSHLPNRTITYDPINGFTGGNWPPDSYSFGGFSFWETGLEDITLYVSMGSFCGKYNATPIVYVNQRFGYPEQAIKVTTPWNSPDNYIQDEFVVYVGAKVTIPSGATMEDCTVSYSLTVETRNMSGTGGRYSQSAVGQLSITGNLETFLTRGIDFGRVVRGEGTVRLDPVSNDITSAETNYMTGKLRVTGAASEGVEVSFPSSVTISGSNGSFSYIPELSTATSDSQGTSSPINSGDIFNIGSAGEQYFWLGGKVDASSAPGPGSYTGSFNVSFQYINF